MAPQHHHRIACQNKGDDPHTGTMGTVQQCPDDHDAKCERISGSPISQKKPMFFVSIAVHRFSEHERSDDAGLRPDALQERALRGLALLDHCACSFAPTRRIQPTEKTASMSTKTVTMARVRRGSVSSSGWLGATMSSM